jgi:MSHA pilin protein MshC
VTKQQGFSLVELVMVMILIGILAAVAIPRLGSLSAYSLTSATADLVEALRYAQQQSMSHSGAAHFRVSISGTGFSVQQGGASVTSPLTGNAYTEDASVWSGVTSAAGTITFDSRGRPTCGGFAACTLPTDSNLTITLQKNGESSSVMLERYTGYARAL